MPVNVNVCEKSYLYMSLAKYKRLWATAYGSFCETKELSNIAVCDIAVYCLLTDIIKVWVWIANEIQIRFEVIFILPSGDYLAQDNAFFCARGGGDITWIATYRFIGKDSK